MKQRCAQHRRQVHLLELEDRDSQPLLSERPSSWVAITQTSVSIHFFRNSDLFSPWGANTMMEDESRL